MPLIVNIMIFSFFPLVAYCLTFFVLKFQGFLSNSLSVTTIWSRSGIHGCNKRNRFFFMKFFFEWLLFLNGLSYRSLIGLKWKIISSYYRWHISLSVSPSTCPSVGSFDHCLSSHSMNFFGTGKTLLPQCPNGKKTLVPFCPSAVVPSCSLSLIWDWGWLWGWCVYASFKPLKMEQCFDIMIPCYEVNFWQSVFQTNNFLYSLYMINLTIHFLFFTS